MTMIENLSVSSKRLTTGCILEFILILLIITPAFSGTTEMTVRKYAVDGLTIINETTVDYEWMETYLPVYGDGTTHYYHQGPVFVDDPDPIVEEELRWNPEEDTNVQEKDMGAVKGTNLKDLCDLAGGMSPGEEIKIISSDGWYRMFAYENVYDYSSREGPIVICWYRDGQYPDTGYSEGMRMVWFADTSTNPWGINAFGNWDWHEAADSKYWYYYENGDEKYPTTTGLSGQIVNRVYLYSADPVPPPIADFYANIKTGQIVNGDFETQVLTPWTGSGATIYTGITSNYKRGTASVKLTAPQINTAWITQDVDLTDVSTIKFYRYMFGGVGKYLQVLVGSTQVANFTETATVGGYQTIDLSSYGFSGMHTIKFNAVNTLTTGSFTIYLDDIEDYGPGISGDAPLIIQFKDTSTKIEDIGNVSWAWDFQNDGSTDSTLQNPVFTYTANGPYSVKLTTTNAGGSDTEIKTDYIMVGTLPPTIDIDTTGGIVNWPFATGTNENTSSVDLSVTTTASSWHVAVKDALDGGKPPGSVGRMAEYNGSAYLDPGGKVLTNALQVNCDGGSYVSLSSSDQSIKTGASSGTFEYDIGLKQQIASGDPALASPNVYRIVVTFTGATD